jgi:uncharacterized protein involved in exopolysaccharide biosynthesis
VNTINQTFDAEEYFDLRAAIATLWAKRWWVVAAVIVFTVAFAAAAFLMTPVFRVSTVMVPATTDRSGLNNVLTSALGSLGGLASLAGVNVGAVDAETEEALAVLRSRQFTEAFIRDRQLMPVLFFEEWDASAKRWRSQEKPPTPAQAFKYFDQTIRTVEQDKKTGLITLHIEWKDREQAAAWANELVERLNAEMRSRAIEKANASVGYLQRELEGTSEVGTREAINRLIEAQIKQRMVANVTREYAFRVVDRAMAPDLDDPVKPRKLLLLLAGPVAGFLVGATVVFLVAWLRAALAPARPIRE